MLSRLVSAVLTILVVALGIRLASIIIEPVLPALSLLLLVALGALLLLGGPPRQ